MRVYIPFGNGVVFVSDAAAGGAAGERDFHLEESLPAIDRGALRGIVDRREHILWHAKEGKRR